MTPSEMARKFHDSRVQRAHTVALGVNDMVDNFRAHHIRFEWRCEEGIEMPVPTLGQPPGDKFKAHISRLLSGLNVTRFDVETQMRSKDGFEAYLPTSTKRIMIEGVVVNVG